MISRNFPGIFFYFLFVGRRTVSRDLKNFLQLVWNMPDTLPKFGRDPLARFRDLACEKSIFPLKLGQKSSKILENSGKSSVSGDFLCLEPCSEHISVTRDLENFLQLVRNMPDTLLKFGRDPLARFRDLACEKFIFPLKLGKKSSKILEN